MTDKLLYPIFPEEARWVVTQTFREHEKRAREGGYCSRPAPSNSCPRGYYFGGIDAGMNIGTRIRAAGSGTVEVRQDKDGYGTHIREKLDDGRTIVYGHLRKALVENGQHVKAGDVIGESGSTGNSSGPHLHFEVRGKDGVPIDPKDLLVWTLFDVGGNEEIPVLELKQVPPLQNVSTTAYVTRPLRIREEPSTDAKQVGTFSPGATAPVIGYSISPDNNEIWINIGYKQWIAFRHPSEPLDLLRIVA